MNASPLKFPFMVNSSSFRSFYGLPVSCPVNFICYSICFYYPSETALIECFRSTQFHILCNYFFIILQHQNKMNPLGVNENFTLQCTTRRILSMTQIGRIWGLLKQYLLYFLCIATNLLRLIVRILTGKCYVPSIHSYLPVFRLY